MFVANLVKRLKEGISIQDFKLGYNTWVEFLKMSFP